MSIRPSATMDLAKHIEQLRVLDSSIPKSVSRPFPGSIFGSASVDALFNQPNPKRPTEGIYDFLLRMIVIKKLQIEKLVVAK